jgi:hypothetical protein
MSTRPTKRKPGTPPTRSKERLKALLKRHLERVGRGALAGMKAIDIVGLLDEMLVQYPKR